MGKKKKNNSDKPIELKIYVLNDKAHQLMETTLLNIEEVENTMMNYTNAGDQIPNDIYMIHDILISDMNVLLHYRQHFDNENL